MTNTPTQAAIEAAARAIDPDIWRDDLPIPTRSDTVAFHSRRQRSIADATAAIEAYRAAMREAGYVEVPVEPTPEMTKAAAAAMSPGHRPDRWVSCSEKHAIRYRAMIAAGKEGE